jgi:hypothetical protein
MAGVITAVLGAADAFAQSATIIRNVNLRPEQSTVEPPIWLLTPAEPPSTLLEPFLQEGTTMCAPAPVKRATYGR